LVTAAKFLVAATKILFVVPNFVAVTKQFFFSVLDQTKTGFLGKTKDAVTFQPLLFFLFQELTVRSIHLTFSHL